jgi:predicted deacylase
MPRLPGRKTVPWMILLQSAMMLREHWGRLDDQDRRELNRIVRKSRGLPNNLSKNDRNELLRIVRRLDLITAGRKLMPFHGLVPRSRR